VTPLNLDAELGSGRGGFALVASVFVLVIVGALVAGGYFVSAHQVRIAAAGPQASSAFYAAEAGLSAGLAQWDSLRIDSLLPGQIVILTSGRLVSGDEYSVEVVQLDSSQDRRAAYYLIRATGRAHGPRGGRRQVALLLKAQPQPERGDTAAESPKLYLPQPLAEFAWFEILE